MINSRAFELFICIASFRKRVYRFIFVMNVVCFCIVFDLSFLQKEKNVFLNSASQLFKRFDMNHCTHYTDHLKQLMFIGHDLFKLTITLLERDFGIVRHAKKISFIF